MNPYRRIMLACMADNPGADPEKLRREFICRVLIDHPFVACQILGQYATKLHHKVVTEAAIRATHGERTQKLFKERGRRAEAYRAELLRRTEA
jgi:hypothetical protein